MCYGLKDHCLFAFLHSGYFQWFCLTVSLLRFPNVLYKVGIPLSNNQRNKTRHLVTQLYLL